jgi:quercetin dioxygenase-like cupin family protein
MIAAVVAAAVMAAQSVQLLDNPSVRVERVHVAAGADVDLDGADAPALIVQLADGSAVYVPTGAAKRVHNGRPLEVDVVVVRLKRSRTPAPQTPAVQAPPGITRTTIIDNGDVRVARVQFSPEGREPVHAHPYDLLTIQLTPGAVEILIGSEKTAAARAPGFVQFVGRDVTHAYASADTHPFDILSVTIK